MRLLSVERANDGKHKYAATFLTDVGRKKTTKFGAAGMDDYIITGSREQRDRYRARHAKDLTTDDPTRAGYLAYYLLWGPSTSLDANIREYRRRFAL